MTIISVIKSRISNRLGEPDHSFSAGEDELIFVTDGPPSFATENESFLFNSAGRGSLELLSGSAAVTYYASSLLTFESRPRS